MDAPRNTSRFANATPGASLRQKRVVTASGRLWRAALDLVWLRQPASARVRVLADNRLQVRARLAKVHATLRLGRFGNLEQRTSLVTEAAKELLAIAGSADQAGLLPDGEALDGGAERVAATLTGESLASTLTELLEARQPFAPASATVERLIYLCRWTEWLLDLRSERERRLRRRLVLAGAIAAVVLAGYAILKDRNLALDKTVTASSIGPYTPVPPPGKDRLSRLVDGVRIERTAIGVEWAHGTHAGGTERQLHPWITIDLGRIRKINQVVVYNRSDCCWGLADVPVALQLSNDNQTFVTVATRAEEYSDEFPWKQPVGGRRARFVRLWSPSESPKELVLSEIEVYGR